MGGTDCTPMMMRFRYLLEAKIVTAKAVAGQDAGDYRAYGDQDRHQVAVEEETQSRWIAQYFPIGVEGKGIVDESRRISKDLQIGFE